MDALVRACAVLSVVAFGVGCDQGEVRIIRVEPSVVSSPAVIVTNTVVVQSAPVTTQSTTAAPTESRVMIMPSGFAPQGTVTTIGSSTVVCAFELAVESGAIEIRFGNTLSLLALTQGSTAQYPLTALAADDLAVRWVVPRSLYEADPNLSHDVGPGRGFLPLVASLAPAQVVTFDADTRGSIRRTIIVTCNPDALPTEVENAAFAVQFAVNTLSFYDRVAQRARTIDGQSGRSGWLTFVDPPLPVPPSPWSLVIDVEHSGVGVMSPSPQTRVMTFTLSVPPNAPEGLYIDRWSFTMFATFAPPFGFRTVRAVVDVSNGGTQTIATMGLTIPNTVMFFELPLPRGAATTLPQGASHRYSIVYDTSYLNTTGNSIQLVLDSIWSTGMTSGNTEQHTFNTPGEALSTR